MLLHPLPHTRAKKNSCRRATLLASQGPIHGYPCPLYTTFRVLLAHLVLLGHGDGTRRQKLLGIVQLTLSLEPRVRCLVQLQRFVVISICHALPQSMDHVQSLPSRLASPRHGCSLTGARTLLVSYVRAELDLPGSFVWCPLSLLYSTETYGDIPHPGINYSNPRNNLFEYYSDYVGVYYLKSSVYLAPCFVWQGQPNPNTKAATQAERRLPPGTCVLQNAAPLSPRDCGFAIEINRSHLGGVCVCVCVCGRYRYMWCLRSLDEGARVDIM